MPSADNETGVASQMTKTPSLLDKEPPGTDAEGACVFEAVLNDWMKPQIVVKQ